jgi:predicted nucleic acid-binding protein
MNDDNLKLIDTNILVYAYDISEGERHELAKTIIKDVWTKGGGAISIQNLCEFFVVVTRKVEQPLPLEEAQTIISDILSSTKWMVIDRDQGTLTKAIELVKTTGTHFWDALIAACMHENSIVKIVTENESDFMKIKDITVLNPFAKKNQWITH